jgi:hypothetical protein
MILLIRDPHDQERLLARSGRPWEHLAAHLLSATLDRRLADGDCPESHPLLAVRAQTLVAPDTRRALAQSWEHLLAVAHRPGALRVPLCRDRLTAAEPDVRDMLVALSARLVPARGVALVSTLLRDGAGPLYNRHCPVLLRTAVRHAINGLDPWVPVSPSTCQ